MLFKGDAIFWMKAHDRGHENKKESTDEYVLQYSILYFAPGVWWILQNDTFLASRSR